MVNVYDPYAAPPTEDPEEEEQEPTELEQVETEQYPEEGQPSGRQVADRAVGKFLSKNAPKGSKMRRWQARLRLARQKGFEAVRNPFKFLFPPEVDEATQLERDAARAGKRRAVNRQVAPPQAATSEAANPNILGASSPTGAESTAVGAETGELAGTTTAMEGVASKRAALGSVGKRGRAGALKRTIADGKAKVAAMRQATLAKARQAAAKAAVKKGAAGALGRVAALVLAEQMIPVVGQILGAVQLALTAIWLAFKTKWGKALMIGLAGVIVLPVIIFMLMAFNIGLSLFPQTAQDQQQVKLGSALAGKEAAKTEVLINVIDEEKARYAIIQKQIDKTDPGRSSEVRQRIADIIALMDAALKASGKSRTDLIVKAVEKDRELGQTLPTGIWIVSSARKYIGTTTVPDGDGLNAFSCNVATRSCASFVSTVLQESGVLNTFAGYNTLAVWNNGSGQVVIDRGGSFDPNRLKPGDVVFFGNGAYAKYSGALFNHVGFYVGDCVTIQGQHCIIDTSSSKKRVVERPITVHQGNNSFSAAKRFGR